ncbi:hypothetical protein N0B31_21015 [Salinirubellus salinus]|uniref:Uncharacterized protein n=1 Tax=Salinirubellus salinus TaxID=1364945 RepID=A0A9E7R2J6_9EURY|nr:hypothetical protein [Salinirubellus salinus]UWM54591.1 hypothetical protein N0B31_21015 [Salinirubellus salinus]
MTPVPTPVLQTGLPEWLTNAVGLAGTLVLVLIVVAVAGTVYKSMTGGIEWPEDREEDDDTVTRSHDDDDEWRYH